jgi:hypothetical protein
MALVDKNKQELLLRLFVKMSETPNIKRGTKQYNRTTYRGFYNKKIFICFAEEYRPYAHRVIRFGAVLIHISQVQYDVLYIIWKLKETNCYLMDNFRCQTFKKDLELAQCLIEDVQTRNVLFEKNVNGLENLIL